MAAALHTHPKVGASWEGFVLEELIGLAGERNAFHWRTRAGAELDLLLFARGKRIGGRTGQRGRAYEGIE
jgi:hypothetical protein